MAPEQRIIEEIHRTVAEHYQQRSSPLLLSDLGEQLRKVGLWPPTEGGSAQIPLRQFIESAHHADLCIVRDRNRQAYIAVTTAAAKPVVERWIERRGQAVMRVPDLEALPRSVILAFCVQIEPGERVFLQRVAPFKFEMCPPGSPAPEGSIEIDDRYRRPGLRLTSLAELPAQDRLDLQTKIASWSRDKSIPIEDFYRAAEKKPANALERLLAAQRPGVADKIVIPADIALLLSRQE